MGKFNYFKMLSKACTGRLTDLEVDELCQQYCRNEANWAGNLLSFQLSKIPDIQVAGYLKVYGKKLWLLYFKIIGAKPYGTEVQKLLIYGMPYDIFTLLPHNLSIDGELLLIEMQKINESSDDCFILAKLEWYLQHYALSFEALLKLIDQSEKLQAANKSQNFAVLQPLCFAVQKFAESSKPNALSSVETQLRILNLADDGQLVKSLLHFFDMKNIPNEKVVQKLIEIGNIDYLKELLSHSCVHEQKEKVYHAFPQLKTELLLSEIGAAACQLNRSEALYAKHHDYAKLVQGYCSGFPMCFLSESGKVMPMLLICKGLYISAGTKEGRCRWIEKAIEYCRFYKNITELQQVIPLLKQALAEEKAL